MTRMDGLHDVIPFPFPQPAKPVLTYRKPYTIGRRSGSFVFEVWRVADCPDPDAEPWPFDASFLVMTRIESASSFRSTDVEPEGRQARPRRLRIRPGA
jgi:hypothetical protein